MSRSMASSMLFKILNKFHNRSSPSIATTANAIFLAIRTRHTGPRSGRFKPRTSELFDKISPLGNPHISLVPVLDQWFQSGKKFEKLELQNIIRKLRARKRYSQALQVSEWISSKEPHTFSESDCAVKLDLICRVKGLESAESYFNTTDQHKTEKLYGALFHCYTREGLVDKSLSFMKKMKEMGLPFSLLNYSDLMCLYTHTGQLEKVPDVLSEMKENGISLDNFGYRICLNSYGARSDLKSMEKLLQEMEKEPHFSMDWNTYSMVANFYIKEGLKEKAYFYLKKCESKVSNTALGYNHMISLYASLGNKDEMMRLWALQKVKCKKQINKDYIAMMGSLVKLGELEETEKLLEEWKSTCVTYDFRVPNTLLIGYTQKGMVEKAETMLRDIIEKQKTVVPQSWAIIAMGYMNNDNMEKAFECLKEALAVHEEHKGWKPKPELINGILSWFSENKDVREVEFVSLLKDKVEVDEEIIIPGEGNGRLEDLKANNVDVGENEDEDEDEEARR